MNMHDLLLKPVITEKTTMMMSVFGVKVKSVATLRTMGKFKRMGKYIGKRPDYKKAIVTLQEGETIEFFEGA